MAANTGKIKEFFDTDAGIEVLTTLNKLILTEYKAAETSEDIQASFAHMKQAAGVRMAVDRIKLMAMEVKKPE